MEDRRPAGVHPVLIFVLAAVFLTAHTHLYGIALHEGAILDDASRLMSWLKGEAQTRDVWFGRERPSPPKMLAAAGGALCDEIWAFRYLTAMLYAWSVVSVYELLRRPRGAAAAYASVAFLLAAPPFFAWSAQASNEIAVTAFLLLAFSASARAVGPRQWFVAGVFFGLAVGTKVTGALGLLVAVVRIFSIRPSRAGRVAGFALAAGALLGFWGSWPVFFLEPGAVWEHIETFRTSARPTLHYFGETLAPSWHYAPVWLFLGMPPLILLLAGIETASFRESSLTRMLAGFVFLGLLAGCLAHDVLREGFRHLLPLGAVVAVLAGMGIGRISVCSRGAALGVALGAVLLGLAAVVRLHPADGSYISELAGGPSAAASAGLQITSSGDVLTENILRRLPAGSYHLVRGRRADGTLDFEASRWRRHATRLVGRFSENPHLRFVQPGHADAVLLLGQGTTMSRFERVVLERDGAVYLSIIPVPGNENAHKPPDSLDKRVIGEILP